jgi:hypothetical protein
VGVVSPLHARLWRRRRRLEQYGTRTWTWVWARLIIIHRSNVRTQHAASQRQPVPARSCPGHGHGGREGQPGCRGRAWDKGFAPTQPVLRSTRCWEAAQCRRRRLTASMPTASRHSTCFRPVYLLASCSALCFLDSGQSCAICLLFTHLGLQTQAWLMQSVWLALLSTPVSHLLFDSARTVVTGYTIMKDCTSIAQ